MPHASADYTSGFRRYSKRLVKEMVPVLHSQTYEIEIQTVRYARKCGFPITETPTSFTYRGENQNLLFANWVRSLGYLPLKGTYPWIDYEITTDAVARKCMMNIDSLTEKILIELLERLQKEKKENEPCSKN